MTSRSLAFVSTTFIMNLIIYYYASFNLDNDISLKLESSTIVVNRPSKFSQFSLQEEYGTLLNKVPDEMHFYSIPQFIIYIMYPIITSQLPLNEKRLENYFFYDRDVW